MDSRNWIRRIIYFQERKPYHVYAILLFALFVGIVRSFEEVALAHRMYQNEHVLNSCAFYFAMAWAFTFILSMLTGVPWRKVANAVLVGVFLGIFPPLIDVLVYGVGGFHYGYVFRTPGVRELLLFDPAKGFPVGEGSVLWLLIFFSAYYVFLKTSSWRKTLIGAILAYLFIITTGGIVPVLGIMMERYFGQQAMIVISILQIGMALILYLVLNYHMTLRLLQRSVHCVPFVLLAFIGAALAGGIKPQTYFVAFLVFLAGVVTLAQNDYFDAPEDVVSGRSAYLDHQDVLFFNITYLAMVLLLYTTGGFLYLPLVVLFICSVLYNYDFYRTKRYFPGNYKIEGMWGLGSFLAGVMSQGASTFSKEILIYAFLVFGGWSLVTTFKDYKDIEADQAAGNQTGYIMLMKAGLSLTQAHRIVSTVIIACFFVPVIWVFFQPVPLVWAVLFPVVTIVPLIMAFRRPPSKAVVRNILLITSAYLFFLLLLLVYYYAPEKLVSPVYR